VRTLGLLERVSGLRVSVLPDFFLDRIVLVPSLRGLYEQLELKAASGGGSLRGMVQTEIKGGNAANLAYALSTLSVRTTLYCVGDSFARAALSSPPSGCRVRVIDGRPGYTVAVEFPFEGKPVNVMLSDVGDISSFDGKQLTRRDLMALRKSDCIAIVNWSANAKGYELARKVYGLRGREGRLNFLDPADLTGAEKRLKSLARGIIDEGLLDVLSLNENEARIIAHAFSVGRLPRSYDRHDIMRVSRLLHNSFSVKVDIHTPIGSASSTNEGDGWVDSFGRISGFVTGAGDIWDAGDIIGHLLHLPTVERLRFANACAHLGLTHKKAKLPSLREAAGLAGL
jgi:ribokinase